MIPFLWGGPPTSPMFESVLVDPPGIVDEPLTLDEAKLRAGLDWLTGDPRDALMLGFIRAARAQVEQDTGLAVPLQTRDVAIRGWSGGRITLPEGARPLVSVTSITAIPATGDPRVLDAAEYVVDQPGGRISLVTAPLVTDRIVVRLVAGYAAGAIPPLLVHAVGLMTAHFATTGRDAVIVGHLATVGIYGYEEAIASYRVVTVA